MKLDSQGRRLRRAPPNQRVRRIVIQEADLLMFEAIDRHGPLPFPYLYAFAKHKRRSFRTTRDRLTELYHGDHGGSYLTRPPRQFDAYEARYQFLVYDLAPRARELLRANGRACPFPPNRAAPFLHQLMQACVAASFELAAPHFDLRYVSRAEILTHKKIGKAKHAKNPMALPIGSGAVMPDDLFALQYPDGKHRFFALEVDRNTESIERKNLDQSAFGRKLDAYLAILKDRSFNEWWGVPNLHVLTVTTNGTHALNMIAYLAKRDLGAYADRFCFAVEPTFGANWRVPDEMLAHLLSEKWITAAEPRDLSTLTQ